MKGERSWNVFPIDRYPDDLWADWQLLANEHHQANPMLSANFVRLLIDAFSRQVFVARKTNAGQLQAMLILEKTRAGVWQGFKPSQAQIALLVMKQGESPGMEQLAKRLPGFCLRIDLFGLDPDEHSALIDSLEILQEYAVNIRIQVSSGFSRYWLSRSKMLQKNLERYKNRLANDGCFERYQLVDNQEEIAAAVDRYGILESYGWKETQGTALHPSNEQGEFYKRLMMKFAEQKHALVFETYLGETLVASRLCIHNEREIVILKTTFDEKLKKYAFGRLNLYKLIEHVHEKTAMNNIEFYTNASVEQISWATAKRSMFNASIYRNRRLEKLVGYVQLARSSLN